VHLASSGAEGFEQSHSQHVVAEPERILKGPDANVQNRSRSNGDH
jgi:hypothetical protein